jgi:hypothetical protein
VPIPGNGRQPRLHNFVLAEPSTGAAIFVFTNSGAGARFHDRVRTTPPAMTAIHARLPRLPDSQGTVLRPVAYLAGWRGRCARARPLALSLRRPVRTTAAPPQTAPGSTDNRPPDAGCGPGWRGRCPETGNGQDVPLFSNISRSGPNEAPSSDDAVTQTRLRASPSNPFWSSLVPIPCQVT